MTDSAERMRRYRERKAVAKETSVTIHMPNKLVDAIDEEAGRRGLPRAEVIIESLKAASKPTAVTTDKAMAKLVACIAACPDTPSFAGDKVFVATLWDRCRWTETCAGMDLEGFKGQLVKCHTAGLLELARADLVQAMDRELVARSEIQHRTGATFHLVAVG